MMPAASTTTWGAAIDLVLADGGWHHRDEILAAAVAVVPPGKAYRDGERLRLHKAGRATPRTRGDQAVAVAAGARSLARQALRSRVRHGTVERDGDRFRRRVHTRHAGSHGSRS